MKKIYLAVALAALIGAGTMATAQAMPTGLSAKLNNAATSLSMIDKTQYFYGGRRYCWYNDGWQGPGWYWCGYAFRRGYGWGGGVGWHGWRGGGGHVSGPRRGGGAVHGGGRPRGGGGHARGGGGHGGRHH